MRQRHADADHLSPFEDADSDPEGIDKRGRFLQKAYVKTSSAPTLERFTCQPRAGQSTRVSAKWLEQLIV
jgi:hypothetical protein